MINIVHAFFRDEGRRRNTGSRPAPVRMLPLMLCMAVLIAADTAAAAAGRSRICDLLTECPGRRPPGAPDRDARPFEGTLGRPCAYRWRYTPSGTRRVRVCF